VVAVLLTLFIGGVYWADIIERKHNLKHYFTMREDTLLLDYECVEAIRVAEVNEQNRKYIDRFVSENYERLNRQFANQREVINSSAYGAIDKLNETILLLYTDPDLHFTDWKQANAYLSGKFTEKAIRIPTQKPITKDCDSEDTDNDTESNNTEFYNLENED
jgi:hypothetical protein